MDTEEFKLYLLILKYISINGHVIPMKWIVIFDIVEKVVTFSECQNNFHRYEDIAIWLTLGFMYQTTKIISDDSNNSSICKSQEVKKYHKDHKAFFQLLVETKAIINMFYFNTTSKTEIF